MRILFFGPPNAGKTGLLHAFADPYDLTPYPPAIGPCRTLDDGTILCDVDGRSAAAVIDDPNQIRTRAQSAAEQIIEADAIVLTLDASANRETMLDLFRSFGRFLKQLEEHRSQSLEVGGLPVFLTLTKCDTLWKPGDDAVEWQNKVVTREESVRTAFEDFLEDEAEAKIDAPYSFGSLDVKVASTALRFPNEPSFRALAGPYGVEELRERCKLAAAAFHRRIRHSRQLLRRLIAAAGAIILAMLILLTLLIRIGDSDVAQLAYRLQEYHDREGPASVRLSDRLLPSNLTELRAIQQHPAFPHLGRTSQEFVATRLKEFETYTTFRNRFRPPQLSPADVRSYSELTTLTTQLDTLTAPPEYEIEWAEADAVKLAAKWKTDLSLLTRAEDELHQWYRGRIREATLLTLRPTIDAAWRADVEKLLSSEQLPFDRSATIPGSPKLPMRRGASLTYAPIFEFDRIDQARGDWEDTRAKVTALRDLCDSLGMTERPSALLDWSEPTSNVDGSRRLGLACLQQLPKADWNASRFPDPVRTSVIERLRRTYDRGVRHVQAVMKSQPSSTDRIKWLATAEAAAWGELLQRIGGWGEFATIDPIQDAKQFLQQSQFAADLSTLELVIPDDLRDRRVRPDGSLVISHGQEWSYRLDGEPTRVNGGMVYRWRPQGHSGHLQFKANDPVSAKVTVKVGDQELKLEWSGVPPYAFESLAKAPTMGGLTAVGVRISAPHLPRLPAVLQLGE